MDQAGDARGRVAGGRRGADDREGLSAHSLREHGWDGVRRRCHALAEEARLRLAERTGCEPLAPDERWFGQMVAPPLSPCDHADLKRRLYDEHRIEAPVFEWNGRPLLRVSFQGYNDERDLERLLAALDGLG